MREELKKYADEAFGIVETAANEIGPRLPGSDNERKFADHMADKLKAIGIEPIKEKFLVAPRASIGGIPYAGWVGIAASVLMLVPAGTDWGVGFHGLAFFMCLATLVWLVCSVFLYKTWFDFAFKQEVSQNVYGEVLPKDGKYDYTIMLSAHTDTSWNWKHSAATRFMPGGPVSAFVKMGLGVVAFLFIFMSAAAVFITELCILTADSMSVSQLETLLGVVETLPDFSIALYILIPLFVIPGCFLITLWADKNPRTASPRTPAPRPPAPWTTRRASALRMPPPNISRKTPTRSPRAAASSTSTAARKRRVFAVPSASPAVIRAKTS